MADDLLRLHLSNRVWLLYITNTTHAVPELRGSAWRVSRQAVESLTSEGSLELHGKNLAGE
jgi:hypothetical protein